MPLGSSGCGTTPRLAARFADGLEDEVGSVGLDSVVLLVIGVAAIDPSPSPKAAPPCPCPVAAEGVPAPLAMIKQKKFDRVRARCDHSFMINKASGGPLKLK